MVSWTYPLSWLSNDRYRLRARAWTADEQVDPSPGEVGFIYDTLPPANAALITPTGGIALSAVSGVTLMWEPVEPDGGSSLAYVLLLDGQPYTSTQTAYTVTHIIGGLHIWGIRVFDAAGNHSGWVTDTFSVRQHDIWLPLVIRDFEPAQTSVLVNGGFETDEGWALNQLAVYDAAQVHSGSRSARVGILPEEPGSNVYSSVAQTFVMPPDADMLTLWLYPIGEGGDTGDWYYVSLRGESNAYYDELDRWQSDARTWEQRSYDLSAHVVSLAGQTVTLYIGAWNDGDDDTAALYVDDVSLRTRITGQ